MRQGSKGSEGAQAPVIFVATEPSFIEQVQEKGFITESGVYRYYGPRNGMISDAITLVGGYMSFITWTLCLQREGGTNNICEKYDILNTFKNRKIKMHFGPERMTLFSGWWTMVIATAVQSNPRCFLHACKPAPPSGKPYAWLVDVS